MLVPNEEATRLKAFIQKVNENKQENAEEAIDAYCKEFEARLYNACQNITITIPPGAIIVQTPQGPGSNINPIVLNGVVS